MKKKKTPDILGYEFDDRPDAPPPADMELSDEEREEMRQQLIKLGLEKE